MTSSSRSTRRTLISTPAVLVLSSVLAWTGGCTSGLGSSDGFATGGTDTSSGSVTSAGGAGGGFLGIGGGSSTGAMSNAGGLVGTIGGGPGNGGGFLGTGGGNLGTGGASEPCENKPYPYDPEWPDATCESWAIEAEACGESWFQGYCDIACGRCVPEGGTGGSGSGGAPPCEDKPYPPDPEWPDATCESWALEAEACGESWFQGYCDVTCGRCVPEGGGTGGSSAVDCSGEGLPNVTGGEGFATRYWDCCQPHCSQFNGHRCSQDGVSSTGDQNSSCNGGGSFACYDEAPRKVSDCLSYGHFAKANPNCGGCYRIQFTGQGEHNANDPGSKLIKGKQMIVKVTNTGSDVGGNQFDLMIPGGGVGQFNACSRQWGTNDLGAQYGGFLSECTGSHSAKKDCVRQECMKIPAGSARDGCIWFVDWFEVADNPKFTSQQTDCPF